MKNVTDLATVQSELSSQSAYSVRVFAKNGVGESIASNIVEYTSPQSGKWNLL